MTTQTFLPKGAYHEPLPAAPRRPTWSFRGRLRRPPRKGLAPMIHDVLDLRLTAADSNEALARTCRLLRDHGLPIDRGSLHARQLHPQFLGRTLYWCAQSDSVAEIGRAHGIQHSDTYLNSPLAEIDQTGQSVRRRLRQLDPARDYPVLAELAAEGFTDYIMLPLPLAGRPRIGLSLATRQPEGFADAQLARVEQAVPALSAVFDLLEQRRTAALLLETYLGRDSGRRVLEGTIRRGEGEQLHAVILSADMRGFTTISQSRPLEATIALLNQYFDAVGRPIEAHGGEILKFIGDEALAIFPCRVAPGEACDAADKALSAARDILDRLAAANRRPEGEDPPRIDATVAVHMGDVMYGNVGAANRLDFTAIGPAVNMVARLQELASRLETPLVVSRELAQVGRGAFRSLGRHPLKGIAEPQEAFTLDGLAAPAAPSAA